MSKSILALINELEPVRVGYEHLSLGGERDLAELFRENRESLTGILAQYDALNSGYDRVAELKKQAESNSFLYAEADEIQADLNEDAYDVLYQLVHLLRKEI